MRLCLQCNKEFEPSLVGRQQIPSTKQKFCSKVCRNKADYANNRLKRRSTSDRCKAKRILSGKEDRWKGPKAQATLLWMTELKSKPCTDCGNCFDICCMDFDHIRGTKVYNLGSMFAHCYSKELIESELAKCELVCSNCHRIRTRDRRLHEGKERRRARAIEFANNEKETIKCIQQDSNRC